MNNINVSPTGKYRCATDSKNAKKRTRLISSLLAEPWERGCLLDRTTLVNKLFIIWPKKNFFSRDQSGISLAGRMGSTRNDYNHEDTLYLLHNVMLLGNNNLCKFIG